MRAREVGEPAAAGCRPSRGALRASRGYLPEQASGGAKQAAPRPRVARRATSVGDGRGSQPAHPRLAAERPLPPDDGVVGERGEREPLRPTPAGARGMNRGDGPPRAQRLDAEVPRPPRHPARVSSRGAETYPASVQRQPGRPGCEPCPQGRVARRGGRGHEERGRREASRRASRRSPGRRPDRRCRRPGRRPPGRRPGRSRPPG